MSSRYRETYPWKIVGAFIEPIYQMQDNSKCLISHPHQGWLCLSLKTEDRNDCHTGHLTDCAFVHHPFPGSEAAISGRVYIMGAGWRLGQFCPLRLFSEPGTESFLAEGPTVCPQCKDCLSSESSQFIFNNWYQDLLLLACVGVWTAKMHTCNFRAWEPFAWC